MWFVSIWQLIAGKRTVRIVPLSDLLIDSTGTWVALPNGNKVNLEDEDVVAFRYLYGEDGVAQAIRDGYEWIKMNN